MATHSYSPLRDIVEVHGELRQHWTLLLILLLGPVQHLTNLYTRVYIAHTTNNIVHRKHSVLARASQHSNCHAFNIHNNYFFDMVKLTTPPNHTPPSKTFIIVACDTIRVSAQYTG